MNASEVIALSSQPAMIAATPAINAELDAMERTVDAQAFRGVREQTLTPEAAYAFWVQKFEIDRLRLRLTSKSRDLLNPSQKSTI